MGDNTTPHTAAEYDSKINDTVPFYSEFYAQTIDVIEGCGYSELDWLDLGCGTGSLEEKALRAFPSARFVAVDPSLEMLEQAKEKLAGHEITYVQEKSADIQYADRFHVVTAIQSHHYMHEEERQQAVQRVYDALKDGGIFICFENVIPESEAVKKQELLRWGRYQQRRGKTEAEALAHNARCGTSYFPLTVRQHVQLLKDTGFTNVHVFWYSYMQMGIYGFKNKGEKVHRVFGKKEEGVEYFNRPGAYVIPVRDGKVAVANTPKGLFLLGGGIEEGETHAECVNRECGEEAGYSAVIKEEICSAEKYLYFDTIGYFHPIQTYYAGDLIEKVTEPIEKDFTLEWIAYDQLKGKMFSEMQNWALEQYFLKYKE